MQASAKPPRRASERYRKTLPGLSRLKRGVGKQMEAESKGVYFGYTEEHTLKSLIDELDGRSSHRVQVFARFHQFTLVIERTGRVVTVPLTRQLPEPK